MSDYFDERYDDSMAKTESSLNKSLTWLREQALRAVEAILPTASGVLDQSRRFDRTYLKAKRKFSTCMQGYRVPRTQHFGYDLMLFTG